MSHHDFDICRKQLDNDLHLHQIEHIKKDIAALYDICVSDKLNENARFHFGCSSLLSFLNEHIDCTEEILAFYQCESLKNSYACAMTMIDLYAKLSFTYYDHYEVEEVKRYVHLHYDEDINVDHLAEHVCLSASYLSHVFKQDTQEKLSDFILRVRMEKAKDLLLHTCEKVIDIAHQVGYGDASYFCFCFKKWTKMTPQQYRTTSIHPNENANIKEI